VVECGACAGVSDLVDALLVETSSARGCNVSIGMCKAGDPVTWAGQKVKESDADVVVVEVRE
jgi:hypothetical protein